MLHMFIEPQDIGNTLEPGIKRDRKSVVFTMFALYLSKPDSYIQMYKSQSSLVLNYIYSIYNEILPPVLKWP